MYCALVVKNYCHFTIPFIPLTRNISLILWLILQKKAFLKWRSKTTSTWLSSRSRRNDMKVSSPLLNRAYPKVLTCCVTEMVECMKNVASADQELSVEERNLLSVAYKNVIGARRASWRIVTSIEQKEESKGNESQVGLIKEYRQKIEAELAKICEDILEVLDEHLIKSAQSGESKVFYHKMYVHRPTGVHTTPAIAI